MSWREVGLSCCPVPPAPSAPAPAALALFGTPASHADGTTSAAAVASPISPAFRMNSRRLTYAFSSVISDEAIREGFLINMIALDSQRLYNGGQPGYRLMKHTAKPIEGFPAGHWRRMTPRPTPCNRTPTEKSTSQVASNARCQ